MDNNKQTYLNCTPIVQIVGFAAKTMFPKK